MLAHQSVQVRHQLPTRDDAAFGQLLLLAQLRIDAAEHFLVTDAIQREQDDLGGVARSTCRRYRERRRSWRGKYGARECERRQANRDARQLFAQTRPARSRTRLRVHGA